MLCDVISSPTCPHELHTPVASVKAMVETLEEGALDDTEVARDFLARIHVEMDGLAHLIEELSSLLGLSLAACSFTWS